MHIKGKTCRNVAHLISALVAWRVGVGIKFKILRDGLKGKSSFKLDVNNKFMLIEHNIFSVQYILIPS